MCVDVWVWVWAVAVHLKCCQFASRRPHRETVGRPPLLREEWGERAAETQRCSGTLWFRATRPTVCPAHRTYMAYPLTLYELGSAWCYVSDSPGARGYGPARPVTLVLRLILRLSKTPALHGDMRGTTVLGFRALKASPLRRIVPHNPSLREIILLRRRTVDPCPDHDRSSSSCAANLDVPSATRARRTA